MTKYPPADATTQNFQRVFPGADMNLTAATCVLCLHSTETSTWPGYMGGAEAPTYTALPRIARKRVDWRQHFPDEKSARALENHPGGVETNTANCVQVELVGTCDPKHEHVWPGVGQAGVDYVYWPAAPVWLLQEVAKFVAYLHTKHGLAYTAAKFTAYPGSISNARMTGAQWSKFVGVCGHQHVPENVHGDPGNLDVEKILTLAKAITDPTPPKPTGPKRLPAVGIFHVHGRRFYYEEDSLRGMRLALAKKLGIDFDVQKTKDDVLIVAHGPRPLAKGRLGGFVDPLGKIKESATYADLTWAEVERLISADGKKYRIRRADELIPRAVKAGIKVVEAEAKTDTITKADWSALRAKISDPSKVRVKAFPDTFLPSLLAAHQTGFVTIALTHPGRNTLPKSARAWVDYFRGRTPRFV